jgi:predicted phage terminase large subunit-like protein
VSLSGFVKEAWPALEPEAKYQHNWHVDAVCEHLEAISRGEINRLLINVPPGTMKSLLVAVFWQAWEWGPLGRPSLRYLTTSFNDGPVKRDTRKCRDLIRSPWFQQLWPSVQLARAGETSFANTQTGTREGVAFGSLTSQRGDRLVIDDPHSTETAESNTDRDKTTRKFREGAQNRLNDQEKSAIVVIMQRLHQDDVSGVIDRYKMDYCHLMLPMEYEPERARVTGIGFKDPRRERNELLHPGRFPRETIEKLKRDMGQYAWAGQYQQRPAPRSGGMFDKSKFEVVPAAPAGGRQVRIWDLAGTAPHQSNTDPDWTVGLKMRLVDELYYVEDVVRDRLNPAGVERLIKNTATQDGFDVMVGIPRDPAAGGKAWAQRIVALLAGYDARILPELVQGTKEARATGVSAQVEAGNVKLVAGPWIDDFLEEVGLFPAGSHDDQVDTLSGAFNELLNPAQKARVILKKRHR